MSFDAPRERIEIKLSTIPYHECSAALFSTLAYPNDIDERGEFMTALARDAIVARANEDLEFRWSFSARPTFFTAPEKVHTNVLKRGLKRLEDRYIAGEMVLPALCNILVLSKPERTVQGKKPTLEAMSELAASKIGRNGQASATNIQNRQWRPSKPVAHLAASVWCSVAEYKSSNKPANLLDFTRRYRPGALSEMIALAELFRPALAKLRSAVPEKDTIQFAAA